LTLKSLYRYTEAIDKLNEYLRSDPKLTREKKAQVEQLIAEMRALLADVTVYVVPDGATVKVDNRVVGTSPLRTLNIAAGSHTIEASAEGYKSQSKDILVTAGVAMTVELQLVALPKSGKVMIDASQPRALVRIDGKNVGLTPVEVELALGGHQ